MTLPHIDLTQDDAGLWTAGLDDANSFTTMADLLVAVPDLAVPDNAGRAAEMANHLSHGNQFAVIHDPAAFTKDYNARYDAEEDTPWEQNKPKLRDFGRADLSALAAPQIEDGILTFFANDRFLGVVYVVRLCLANGTIDYTPVPING